MHGRAAAKNLLSSYVSEAGTRPSSNSQLLIVNFESCQASLVFLYSRVLYMITPLARVTLPGHPKLSLRSNTTSAATAASRAPLRATLPAQVPGGQHVMIGPCELCFQ